MDKAKKKKTYYALSTNKMFIVLTIFLLVSSLSVFIFSGCGVLEIDFFGKKFGGADGGSEETASKEIDDISDLEGSNGEEDTGQNEDVAIDDISDTSESHDASEDNDTGVKEEEKLELEELRFNFIEAMKHFSDESFIIAEYYLNKIEKEYLVLQDHILYYKAKSLLMQEKYEQSEEFYRKLVENFPDSVWSEKAVLEIADLYYMQEDYISAEERYSEFLLSYPSSEYFPYASFQLAVCLAKNEKIDKSFSNFKSIWLDHPASEYSSLAYQKILDLKEEGLITDFDPTPEELFKRGENLFYSFDYQGAIDEFNKILDNSDIHALSSNIYSETCFRLGMSYYNMSDYGKAASWLLVCYEEAPESSITDAALFFLGRAYTNLGNNSKSISYYQKLLSKYPSSDYGDDAYYRMGRLYSVSGDSEKAIESFQQVFEKYPSGDKTDESLWELGWMQYKKGFYDSAKTTFSNISSKYSGTSLGEKGLFWKANTCVKLGEESTAIELCRQIIDDLNYSYYTFAAAELAKELGTKLDIQGVNNSLFPDNPELEILLPIIFENLNMEYVNIDGRVDHITKAVELLNLGFGSSASLEINAGSNILEEDPVRVLEIATFYYEAEDYANCMKTIYSNYYDIRKGLSGDYLDYTYYLYYPFAYGDMINRYSSEYGLDPLFTLSVIRQESSFRPDAGSYAGAQGLMQIMPATGKGIAKQIGLTGYQENMLIDPEISIRMGTYYLRQQLDNFNENLVYCLGAYNGGPGAMSGWVSKRGSNSIDEFIENITYLETREYIKKVMGNYYFYKMLYPG